MPYYILLLYTSILYTIYFCLVLHNAHIGYISEVFTLSQVLNDSSPINYGSNSLFIYLRAW